MTEPPGQDPDRFAELMQRAGRRAAPPELTRTAVYDAARDAWRRQVRRRMQRRQLAVAASMLGVAVLAGIGWLWHGGPAVTGNVATIESLAGDVRLRTDSGAGPALAPAPGRALEAGELLETGPGSRLVLRRPGGILVHVASGSSLLWQTGDALRLTRGLVYVDTDSASDGDELEIVTHTSRIRHIGTRFSVQVAQLEVRVMVRDGAVSIGDSRNQQRVETGYEARIDADGRMLSNALAPDAGPWQWLATAEPRFVVEGRSLHAVLTDLALAQGVELTYGSAQIESSARRLLLHGPALELAAEPASDAVLLTTQFARRPPFEIVPRP